MRRNVLLNAYNSHKSWSDTGNYVVKTCSQKFHLCVQFITGLNTLVHEWAHAHAIAHLSWIGLILDSPHCSSNYNGWKRGILLLFEERSSYFVEHLLKAASERIKFFYTIYWRQGQSSNLRSIHKQLFSFLLNVKWMWNELKQARSKQIRTNWSEVFCNSLTRILLKHNLTKIP